MSSKTIWTPANIVTCARVVLVPFWLLLAQLLGVSLADSLATPGFNLGAFLVFIGYVVISLTDKLLMVTLPVVEMKLLPLASS